MSDLRTAANQMLEALEGGADSWQLVGPAIDALKEALVESDIDPVDEYRKGFIDGQIDMRDRPAEPVGCNYCNHPLFATTKCQLCGRATKAVQEPYCYIYEYDSPYGLHREFYPREYNGMKPSRTVPLYTAPPQRPAAPIIKPEIKEDKPFGYFRAEPFGWTDCAPTDEGAIPLYERPQAQQFLYNAWADEQIQKEKK